jgi:hypothetical protein
MHGATHIKNVFHSSQAQREVLSAAGILEVHFFTLSESAWNHISGSYPVNYAS